MKYGRLEVSAPPFLTSALDGGKVKVKLPLYITKHYAMKAYGGVDV
jgi:hypothetical protein